MGNELPCYTNDIKSASLRKCPHDRQPTDKVYFTDIRVATSLTVLPTTWRRKPAGIDMERNYVTLILCTVNSLTNISAKSLLV